MESLIFSIITPVFSLVVDRLSVLILSIFMIIGIGNYAYFLLQSRDAYIQNSLNRDRIK